MRAATLKFRSRSLARRVGQDSRMRFWQVMLAVIFLVAIGEAQLRAGRDAIGLRNRNDSERRTRTGRYRVRDVWFEP